MSDEFWRHFGERKGGFLSGDDTDEDERLYQPWRTNGQRHGPIPKLLFVGAPVDQGETWRVPYLQTIDQHYDPASQQLCLMFRSSGLIVFLKGQGLQELDALIEERRIRSVHVFDPAFHHCVSDNVPIITQITVELSS